jgi:hypothetical protein
MLAILAVPSIAVPDSVVTGPYNISFDLGLPHDAYTISIKDPAEEETLGGDMKWNYRVEILDNNRISNDIDINLERRESMEVFSGAAIARGLQSAMENFYEIVEATQRTIDGKDGGIAKGTRHSSDNKLHVTITEEMYIVNYYPYKDTSVFITSTRPWDKGTLQLLKTIHIEKTGSSLFRVGRS